MGDHNAGLAGAAAVCAALYSRAFGEGQLVSTSLLQGLYTISFDLSVLLGWGLTLQIGQRVDGQCCDEQLLGERRQALLGGRT